MVDLAWDEIRDEMAGYGGTPPVAPRPTRRRCTSPLRSALQPVSIIDTYRNRPKRRRLMVYHLSSTFEAPYESGTWEVLTGEAVKGPMRGGRGGTPVLLDTARTYNKVVTYKEFGGAVQTSGVPDSCLLNNWIGEVLVQVARDCQARDEVLLTALCVRQDGAVGDGFAGPASGSLFV